MEKPLIFRVLIASRGEMATRLIRQFREAGTETAVVFSEPDVDAPWVEEADYPVYLNGRTVAETYLDPMRVVAAACDAGCEAIHPGYCFLAERVDFFQLAEGANVAVVGADLRPLAKATDRMMLRHVARQCGIPLVPATDRLADADEGAVLAAQLGFPLYVKAVAGSVIRRVNAPAELAGVVRDVRQEATLRTGDSGVYLERAIPKLRRIGTTVVGDRFGTTVHLGHTDATLEVEIPEVGVHCWVEEYGDNLLSPDLAARLGDAAVDLARTLKWTGVGKVRWAVTPDGGWYLLGFSGRLTTGFDLVELVQGVDLIQAQVRVQAGQPLGWSQEDVGASRHGVQLRIVPVAVASGSVRRAEGRVEALELPEGEHVRAVAGTAEGQAVSVDTEPLLAKISVSGPTRHAALVMARKALDGLVVEGVSTNKEFLARFLANEQLWRLDIDADTLARELGLA
jgi:acetyl/propionyl-CoA carboxylase alpha subunit